MKIAIITAGGAGLFCGSCMQDNTLARTLRLAGHDAVLVPTYTPIRVDEEDVSADRVFLGGVNVYLDSMLPGWKRLPGWMIHWLNRPAIIRRLTGRAGSTDPASLGSLTVDMLAGRAGPQRREIHELVSYLCNELQPDIIIFSNALLSGVLTELRSRFSGTILCLLQGDDIFLDALTERWKGEAVRMITANCQAFDGFLTHSNYYRAHMRAYLSLPDQLFRTIPLSIDTDERFLTTLREQRRQREESASVTIGYFARICPEKGIDRLLASAERVLPSRPQLQFVIAGYLQDQHRAWFETRLKRAQEVVSSERLQWLGSPDTRERKFEILASMDALCVPTVYREPKGLYVLEAALMGVPAIVPDHGAFPEILSKLGHGTLVSDGKPGDLDDAIIDFTEAASRDAQKSLPSAVENHFGLRSTAPVLSAVLTDS